MPTFVLALKRYRMSNPPRNWVDLVEDVRGVVITARPAGASRIVVDASESGANELRRRLGEWVHVEEIVRHRLAV
jgi:hypothetical protein